MYVRIHSMLKFSTASNGNMRRPLVLCDIYVAKCVAPKTESSVTKSFRAKYTRLCVFINALVHVRSVWWCRLKYEYVTIYVVYASNATVARTCVCSWSRLCVAVARTSRYARKSEIKTGRTCFICHYIKCILNCCDFFCFQYGLVL